MTDTMQAISRSLGSDVKTLATISHNIANMHTPGYRAARADFADALHGRISVDQSDGALMQTYRPLDLALRGPGFFAVERDGKTLLSRAGALRVDSEQRLVTARGDVLLGLSGPVPNSEALTVRRDGQVAVDGRPIGQLQIVAVADPSRLRAVEGGLYAYDGDMSEWKGSVIQGALEGANVDAAEETVRLMETTRHAESLQRAISIYDKTMDVGINQIGGN
jgi:flagellar basal-body rod protein FlgF